MRESQTEGFAEMTEELTDRNTELPGEMRTVQVEHGAAAEEVVHTVWISYSSHIDRTNSVQQSCGSVQPRVGGRTAGCTVM